MIFFNRLNLFHCLHLSIKSHLWFNNFSVSGYNIICIFSSKHRLHLSKHFGVFNFFHMFHWISGVKPSFFKFPKCLDWAVWFFKCSWEKEWLWLLNINVHSLEEIPIWVFVFLTFSFGKMIPWYNTFSKLHNPLIGHLLLVLQLHSFCLLVLLLTLSPLLLLLLLFRSWHFLIISLLWLLIISKIFSCRSNYFLTFSY